MFGFHLHAVRGYAPKFFFNVELIPARAAQFAGTHESE